MLDMDVQYILHANTRISFKKRLLDSLREKRSLSPLPLGAIIISTALSTSSEGTVTEVDG